MNDLINRQDAIDEIDHYLGEVETIPMGTAFKEGVKDGYCRIRSIIMSLPSADKDCPHYYKGYCSEHEDGCFHQCNTDRDADMRGERNE